VHELGQLNTLPDIQGSNASRAIQLVARNGQHVYAHRFDIHVQLADGLRGISVKKYWACTVYKKTQNVHTRTCKGKSATTTLRIVWRQCMGEENAYRLVKQQLLQWQRYH
jgi:hypothetical protein